MIRFIIQLLCSHGRGQYRDWIAIRANQRDGEAPMFCMKCGKNIWKVCKGKSK